MFSLVIVALCNMNQNHTVVNDCFSFTIAPDKAGGLQLILAYCWARPAILVAGKGREGMFLCLLFLDFHSCSSFFRLFLPSLSSLLLSLLSLFSLSLGDDTK